MWFGKQHSNNIKKSQKEKKKVLLERLQVSLISCEKYH